MPQTVQPSSIAAAATDAALPPALAATQEVRFAVVMYGGVSLAIYINGVARELFRLVQSTAPERRHGDRTGIGAPGTSAVYRKLGQLLDGGRLRTDLCDIVDGRVVLKADAGPNAAGEAEAVPPVRTRFVVDILSGTSAGGINAVYLAKALANDGDFEVLRDLWLEEADIGLLVHDAKSEDAPFRTPAVPASLLNGNRMYFKLLDALARVGPPRDDAASRLVEELDLFVTATDVRGLPVSITLEDVVVAERRHRNVFRFRYATRDAGGGRDHNDFVPENDAFLAFAARCTSAFPGAFEPMCLRDGHAALPDAHASSAFARRADWARFHREYDRDDFDARAFQDGGSLDNKPFTHATEALLRRRADTPVDRKLIYIEPVPEPSSDAGGAHARATGERNDCKPDMLENVGAALVGLPRYETIRDDLERLLDRNRIIARVDEILRHREEDVRRRRVRGGDREAARLDGRRWAERDLSEMIDEHGVAYGAYHRLKVGTVLDDMAELLVRVGGVPADSAEQRGMRRLLLAWKEKRFPPYREAGGTGETENAFLFRYDLGWWLRRIAFVQEKTSELLTALYDNDGARLRAVLCAHPEGASLAASIAAFDVDQRAGFDAAQRRIRRALNDVYVHLRASGRALRSRSDDNPLRPHVDAFMPAAESLRALSAARGRLGSVRADELLATAGAPLDELGDAIATALGNAIAPAAAAARSLLGLEDRGDPTPGVAAILSADDIAWLAAVDGLPATQANAVRAAQQALRFYYEEFEYYDLIAFPILHEAGVGESDIVDVIRVSPIDARMLVPDAADRRRKLAGTFLANFGAFFERDWRLNDMVWGRLDAAERVVAALMPDTRLTAEERAIRDALIAELHDAIFAEEGVDREQLIAAVQSERALDAEPMVDVAARTSRVLGQVLEPIAAAGRRTRAIARWPRRLTGGFAALVSATVAGTAARRRMLMLIAAAYAAGAGLLVFGYGERALHFAAGALTFAAAAGTHALLAGLRRAIHGRQGALRIALSAAVAIVAIAVVAVIYGAIRF